MFTARYGELFIQALIAAVLGALHASNPLPMNVPGVAVAAAGKPEGRAKAAGALESAPDDRAGSADVATAVCSIVRATSGRVPYVEVTRTRPLPSTLVKAPDFGSAGSPV